MTNLSKKIISYERNKIEDQRGWFLKIITGKEVNLPNLTGEIYITSAKPHQMKGGHYHRLANEWFTVIKGSCLLKLEDLITKETLEFRLDSQNPITVYVPSGIAHAFFNISDSEDFILIAYSDQLFDKEDTIPFEFKKS